MLYVVIEGQMYQKIDGELRAIATPLTLETNREIQEVWKRYDANGRPFMMYHEIIGLTVGGKAP